VEISLPTAFPRVLNVKADLERELGRLVLHSPVREDAPGLSRPSPSAGARHHARLVPEATDCPPVPSYAPPTRSPTTTERRMR
jgi:hypothetical protein